MLVVWILPCTFIVPSLTTGSRVEEAMQRSIRWLDRCIAYHESKSQSKQNLFAIIQGGLDTQLRDICLDEMIKRKGSVAGYAIGGTKLFPPYPCGADRCLSRT